MVNVNRRLEDGQELDGEARPALAENQVVGVLNADAGGAANKVEGIEEFLDVEESDFPRVFLSRERRLESIGGALMSAAGVVEDDG